MCSSLFYLCFYLSFLLPHIRINTLSVYVCTYMYSSFWLSFIALSADRDPYSSPFFITVAVLHRWLLVPFKNVTQNRCVPDCVVLCCIMRRDYPPLYLHVLPLPSFMVFGLDVHAYIRAPSKWPKAFFRGWQLHRPHSMVIVVIYVFEHSEYQISHPEAHGHCPQTNAQGDATHIDFNVGPIAAPLL